MKMFVVLVTVVKAATVVKDVILAKAPDRLPVTVVTTPAKDVTVAKAVTPVKDAMQVRVLVVVLVGVLMERASHAMVITTVLTAHAKVAIVAKVLTAHAKVAIVLTA